MKSNYRITVDDDVYFRHLVDELEEWQVESSRYRIEGNTIFTNDKNVVDVATETFINCPGFLSIEKIS